MPFTTAKTTWAANERPTADDLNRIEANAEGGAKPVLSQSFYGVGEVTNTTGVFSGHVVAHTSRTGRVKVTIIAAWSNSTGGIRLVTLVPARNGAVLPGGEISVMSIPNGEQTSQFAYIVDLTPSVGVSYNYGFRHRVNAGSGPTVYQSNIIVEDV